MLVIAGAPLGNVGDASPRFGAALAAADIVAAEDTRRVRRLAADLGVTIAGRVISYFEGNERERAQELVDELKNGASVVVVSDAGMPGVSDPGYRIIRAAINANIAVQVLPGPSAVTTALVASGLATDRFCFEGFLPRKAGERRRALGELSGERRTMVFFEAPHRLAACLEQMADIFSPQRPAAVCRELTKTYEEIKRGSLAELALWAAEGVRGEITVVVAGATPQKDSSPTALAAAVHELEAVGIDRRAAMSDVAKGHGVSRRVVYDAILVERQTR